MDDENHIKRHKISPQDSGSNDQFDVPCGENLSGFSDSPGLFPIYNPQNVDCKKSDLFDPDFLFSSCSIQAQIFSAAANSFGYFT